MTTTGSGVGGNVGGPAIPLQTDIEATAWTNINKAALGIVHDSIDRAFVEMNPRYSIGFLGGFGYRASAQNPLLDHPLESLRRSELSNQMIDDSWQIAYQNLVNQLPADLLARFNSEGSKPFEQRNLSFTALDNLLRMTAKTLAQTAQSAQPTPIGTLEDERTILNLLLPFAALKGSISNSLEIIDAALGFLTSQGANYRYFDGFNNLIANMQAPLGLMQRVNDSLGNTVNGQLTPQARSDAAKAAQKWADLGAQLEKISLGPDLQLLLATIGTMEMVATALSLPNTSTAPLFIAASLASIGLFTSDSAMGSLGSNYRTLLDNLNLGLITGLMPLNNKAGNELLTLVIGLSLTTFAGLGAIAYNSGLGIYPKRDPQALDGAHLFAFEIALQLAVSSGFIETFYKEMIAVSGGSEKAQQLGGSTLAQLALLVIILAGSNASKTDPARLIEGEATYIHQGILSAAEIERAAESEKTAAAAIALQLSTLALESHDYAAFIEAFNNILESIGISQEALQKEIAELNSSAQAIVDLINLGNPDQQLTRIVTVI